MITRNFLSSGLYGNSDDKKYLDFYKSYGVHQRINIKTTLD